MYQVEDAVLYGSDGLCWISDIVTKDFLRYPDGVLCTQTGSAGVLHYLCTGEE